MGRHMITLHTIGECLEDPGRLAALALTFHMKKTHVASACFDICVVEAP